MTAKEAREASAKVQPEKLVYATETFSDVLARIDEYIQNDLCRWVDRKTKKVPNERLEINVTGHLSPAVIKKLRAAGYTVETKEIRFMWDRYITEVSWAEEQTSD